MPIANAFAYTQAFVLAGRVKAAPLTALVIASNGARCDLVAHAFEAVGGRVESACGTLYPADDNFARAIGKPCDVPWEVAPEQPLLRCEFEPDQVVSFELCGPRRLGGRRARLGGVGQDDDDQGDTEMQQDDAKRMIAVATAAKMTSPIPLCSPS